MFKRVNPRYLSKVSEKRKKLELIIDLGSTFAWEWALSERFRPGDVVPVSGLYRLTPEESDVGIFQVTFIRGRRFPEYPRCQFVTFELIAPDEAWRHQSGARGDRKKDTAVTTVVQAAIPDPARSGVSDRCSLRFRRHDTRPAGRSRSADSTA